MSMAYSVLFAFLLYLSPVVAVWSVTLKGTVSDDSGVPLSGIAVTVKGTKRSATTVSGGKFAIVVPEVPATLVFTGAGYDVGEFQVNGKDPPEPITVTLHASRAALDEVVVTGYDKAFRSSASTPAPSALRKPSALAVMDVAVARSSPVKSSERSRGIGTGRRASGVLTAGEVSDFKKWKLWADYTTSEFTLWSRHWGMSAKYRYCVQVQNGDHTALAGEQVYLVSQGTADTVWHAITDNTGKAELWAGFSGDEQERPAYRIVCNNQVITSAAAFENGVNRIVVKKPCNVSNAVDIAFVVDATGSMGDEIAYLQEELQDIIGKTAARYANVHLRTGAVFYRDHSDAYLTRHIGFQSDPAQLVNFIKAQAAGGGGDTPEAVEDALATALDSLHWDESARAKLLFLVLDAPPHDKARGRMNVLIRLAAAKGIRIVPVVCSGIDKSTEYLMRCIALATNGSYVFLTDDSGIGNPHIKPTTDAFTVELLTVLLQRIIGEMIYVQPCSETKRAEPVNGVAQSFNLNVYPNPTRGSVNIASSQQVKELFITDFTGKVLLRVAASGRKGKWEADLGRYPSGTYLVRYLIPGKGWSVEKVVLMH